MVDVPSRLSNYHRFIIYPFINGIRLSFTNWNGFSQTYDWIGLQQYKRLLADPTTWLVIKIRCSTE